MVLLFVLVLFSLVFACVIFKVFLLFFFVSFWCCCTLCIMFHNYSHVIFIPPDIPVFVISTVGSQSEGYTGMYEPSL